MRTLHKPMAVLFGAVLLAAACGDDSDSEDDDASTDEATADSDETAAYCDLAQEMAELQEPPSDELLEGLKETAPDEIAENVDNVVDAVRERGVQAFFDEDVEEQFGPIEEYEQRECGIDPESEEAEELPEGVSTEIDPDAQQVAVSATDYDFTFDAPEAGAVSFTLTNDGEEAHHMGIVRLEEGVTLEDAMAMEDPEEVIALEAFTDPVGPGDEAVLTFENLEPGEYHMLCFLPTEDGTPHVEEGMAVTFTVS